MKLTYQVGIAALIHLAIITLFNVVNGLQSSVQECTSGDGCIGNIITSMLYFMVTTIWFVLLWIIAAAAQERRSRKLTFLLLGGEAMVFVISVFNAQHHNHLLGLVTSLVDAALAVWVGMLALRLFKAGGGRVTASKRSRQRRLKT